ncbi:MAG: hypothetical protein CVV56_03015 [Tenericutes bacterium HGW-Tenericutes-1]|jgi:hypothetical protein|nr:MAG: hypothetical protein CVV56_03015 [Tenericutes bacterium HGW-Tenericutes-1]
MDYQTVFETRSLIPNGLIFYFLGPIILIAGIIIFKRVLENKESFRKRDKVCAFIMIALGSFFILTLTLFYFGTIVLAVSPYRNGDFEVAEGYVENLEGIDYPNGYDNFDVDGIHFEIGNSLNPGLNKKAYDGGPISSEDLYVRIYYVSVQNHNCIFKVEVRTNTEG